MNLIRIKNRILAITSNLKHLYLYCFIVLMGSFDGFSQISLDDKMNEAKALQADNKIISARIIFNEILNYDSTYYEARLLRGVGYYQLQNFSKAIIDFDFIIRNNLFIQDALYYRASLNARISDFTRVIVDCNRALELNPDDKRMKLMRISALVGVFNFDQGLVECNEFIEKWPEESSTYIIRAICKRELNPVSFIDFCTDVLIAVNFGFKVEEVLKLDYCIEENFPYELGACHELKCLSPLAANYKLVTAKPIQEELIYGEWELTAKILTWEDKDLQQMHATYLIGKYKEDYEITYHFLKDSKGVYFFKGMESLMSWKFVNNNQIELINHQGNIEQFVISSDGETIELIQKDTNTPYMYTFLMLKRVKN